MDARSPEAALVRLEEFARLEDRARALLGPLPEGSSEPITKRLVTAGRRLKPIRELAPVDRFLIALSWLQGRPQLCDQEPIEICRWLLKLDEEESAALRDAVVGGVSMDSIFKLLLGAQAVSFVIFCAGPLILLWNGHPWGRGPFSSPAALLLLAPALLALAVGMALSRRFELLDRRVKAGRWLDTLLHHGLTRDMLDLFTLADRGLSRHGHDLIVLLLQSQILLENDSQSREALRGIATGSRHTDIRRAAQNLLGESSRQAKRIKQG